MIATYHNIAQGTITITCDNTEAGKNSLLATKKDSVKSQAFLPSPQDMNHKKKLTYNMEI